MENVCGRRLAGSVKIQVMTPSIGFGATVEPLKPQTPRAATNAVRRIRPFRRTRDMRIGKQIGFMSVEQLKCVVQGRLGC